MRGPFRTTPEVILAFVCLCLLTFKAIDFIGVELDQERDWVVNLGNP